MHMGLSAPGPKFGDRLWQQNATLDVENIVEPLLPAASAKRERFLDMPF